MRRMPTERRSFLDRPIVSGVLLLIFLLQAARASLIKSPVFDEPAHIGAGLSYLKTGEFKVNLQHPSLLKEIAAVPLLLRGVRWPVSQEDWDRIVELRDASYQWRLGADVIFGNDPDQVLFWSRLPFLLLSTLLGWLLFVWGRRLFGGAAATGAVLLYTLDPTILAHGYLVTTDVGFAAFAVLFFYALWSYLEHRTPRRLLACSLALGGMMGTKFSAIFLLPVAAVLVFWAVRLIPASVPRRLSSLVDPYASDDPAQRFVWGLYALLSMGAVAAVVLHVLYLLPGNPFLYLKGMLMVNADHDRTYLAFMAGHFQPRFLTYYIVAYLLKEPIASLILVAAGLWAILRPGGSTTLDRAFVLLPPAAILIAHSLLSDDLGIRYIIPALPFLYLAGGAGVAWLLREGGWRRAAVGLLCLWMAVEAAAIYPDHLSYFNELACLPGEAGRIGLDGGTACGPLWFDDSNVDWGQGLKQLRDYLAAHYPHQSVLLAYFGSTRPERYGIDSRPIGLDDLVRPPAPGVYVLSSHFLARGIGMLRQRYLDGPDNWLLHARPTAIVGHAYAVYDIPSAPGR